jgi:hypothetical protein
MMVTNKFSCNLPDHARVLLAVNGKECHCVGEGADLLKLLQAVPDDTP